jgi:hypothetical protein
MEEARATEPGPTHLRPGSANRLCCTAWLQTWLPMLRERLVTRRGEVVAQPAPRPARRAAPLYVPKSVPTSSLVGGSPLRLWGPMARLAH